MNFLLKISRIPPAYALWGVFILFLAAQFLWCQFAAYPAAFEKQLRRGKSWVYIPLRWRGFRKLAVLSLSRLLILAVAGSGALLCVYLTGRQKPVWVVSFTILLLLAVNRLSAFWIHLRYRQQEDAYYSLHDALRAKLDQEGKDYTEAQFRSLAAYQHQQLLHKADEAGEFFAVLRREAKRAREAPAAVQPVEA